MPISVLAVHPNTNIPPSLAIGGLSILSGVVEVVFRGTSNTDLTRDVLSFTVGRVNLGSLGPTAACVMSLASIAFDGPVTNALWAVDSALVTGYANVDRGSGTADINVVGNLAVRGMNGIILRVSYTIFYFPS
ncbi:MAG: hypothetical protein ACJ746_00820 [Bryobacteraceae bacterium]|jgi:hypothetical protein